MTIRSKIAFAPADGSGGSALVEAAQQAAQAAQAAQGTQGGAQGQQQGQQGQQADQGQQGQQAQQGQQQAPKVYMPEGLPDTFKGANEREIIDKLWKAHSDAPKPPAAATDYKLEMPKELQAFLDPAKDPVLPLFRDVAMKVGLTQTQFQGAIAGLYSVMAEKGLLQQPVDLNAEFAAIGGVEGDTASRVQRGIAKIQDLETKLTGLATRQQISKDHAAALVGMMVDRTSTAAIERLLSLLPAELGVQGGGAPGGQGGQGTELERSLAAMYPTMLRRA